MWDLVMGRLRGSVGQSKGLILLQGWCDYWYAVNAQLGRLWVCVCSLFWAMGGVQKCL